MKVLSFAAAFLIAASFSINAQAHQKKQVRKYKTVAVIFDQADVQKHDNRAPASEVEKAEMAAQARSYARVNRDDWGSLEF